MKRLLIGFIAAFSACAQTNIVYSWTLQSAASDTAVTINATQDEAIAVTNWGFAQTLATSATLTAGVSAGATTFTLSAIPAGLTLGNGICISPAGSGACGITMTTNGSVNNLVYSTGEIARVLAVSGTGPYTVTVKRGSIGTAAAYSTGQAVIFMNYGSYSDLSAGVLRNFQSSVILQCQYNAYSCTTNATTIAAAQAAQAAAANTH